MTAPQIITDRKTDPMVPTPSGPRGFVPLRRAPDDTALDPARAHLVKSAWSSLDDLYRPNNRQIEENVRMVQGQQHVYYHAPSGRFLDVTDWMTPEDRAWKPRPIFNKLLPWFIITHARATENSPIVTFVPGPDRADAELAEILDIAYKTLWFEANMEDVHDRLMAWVIIAGRGHLMSRINPNTGQMRKWLGSDLVPVVDVNDQPVGDGEGGQAHMMADDVPFDANGRPQAVWRMTGETPEQGELVPTGPAHQSPIGAIEVDVLSPLQVRASWGPEPWWKKRRHLIKSYHTPEEFYDLYQLDVPPDTKGRVSDVGELERILYGTGFFPIRGDGSFAETAVQTSTEGYIEVTQLWEAPCSYGGMERQGESPGGRWTVVTGSGLVVRDGPRPVAFPYTSPVNTFDFVRLPGRHGGGSPQEALNHIQREINDGVGRVKAHVAHATNPQTAIDTQSGLVKANFTNKPGQKHFVNRRPGVPAIEHIQPPRLGPEVGEALTMYAEQFDEVGFTAGANDPGTPGDSGEKVKEVRFNTDRFLGPTMRRSAGEYGRVVENWTVMLPLVWDMETVIHYAGDDNIAQTITVYPEMWKEGKCNVRPDVESMLPEGRGEKQDKVVAFYNMGLFGLPGSPVAVKKFWELAHMPHLSRAAKVGGIDATTAEQENGKILLGTPAQLIPVFEWYDDQVHLMIHENFMKSPSFAELDPAIQNEFAMHRMAHQFNAQKKLIQAVQQQAGVQNMLAPPGGPGGAPGPGGGPPGSSNKPSSAANGGPGPGVRPGLPTPPSGPVPGGSMPTVAGAPPA